VELFFVISGFVLSLPFAAAYLAGKKGPSLGAYLLRRVTRLEPPYLISLLAFFCMKVLMGTGAAGLFPHLVASGGYLHNLIFGTWSLVSIVAWSLEVEVQFYLVAPLLAGVLFRRPRAQRITLLVALIVVSATTSALVGKEDFPRYFLSLPGFLHFFLLGFGLAEIYLVDWDSKAPKCGLNWDAAGVLAFLSLCVLIRHYHTAPLGRLLGPALTFIVVVSAFRGFFLNRFFTSRLVYTIGGMCYSIYLWHVPVLLAASRWSERVLPAGAWLLVGQTVVVLCAVLFVSTIMFVVLERPCMDRSWPQKLAATLSKASFSFTAALRARRL
jgi:peptidoglycan/LPS O-acetylase OafA/YrhL